MKKKLQMTTSDLSVECMVISKSRDINKESRHTAGILARPLFCETTGLRRDVVTYATTEYAS